MNSFLVDVCEICGTQAADHAGWYAVAGSGPTMEILPWTDEVRGLPDCRHACCSDHVQQLVFSTATRGLATPTLAVTPRHGGWNPDALVPVSNQQPENRGDDPLVTLLSALDSILQTRPGDEDAEEEESAEAFDA